MARTKARSGRVNYARVGSWILILAYCGAWWYVGILMIQKIAEMMAQPWF